VEKHAPRIAAIDQKTHGRNRLPVGHSTRPIPTKSHRPSHFNTLEYPAKARSQTAQSKPDFFEPPDYPPLFSISDEHFFLLV
jgi:hypothetical protein